jgi:CubicO group peptidase (beta-lactamase class C family)
VSKKSSVKIISGSMLTIFVGLVMVFGIYNCCFSMKAKLDNYIKSYVDLDLFRGAVLVAKDGKILLCKAYGMANVELDVPNKIDTKFRLGSITKQFTAMAIMQLKEKGFLDLQDPLSKYIPDYPNGDKITIHHLLSQTSGIPEIFSIEGVSKKTVKTHTLEKLISRFKDKPLDFNPGEKFAYSNSNYMLLTYIIEKVSGKKYETFLKENIFEPLNMKDTGYDDYNRIIKNRASGYSLYNGELENADYVDMSFPSGAGALYSTVKDLYLWDQALYTDKLVSQESIKKIFTPYIDSSNSIPKTEYGYGWFIQSSPHGKLVSHGGQINGFSAFISRYIENKVCIIILSNFAYTSVWQISENLADITFGKKPNYTPKKHIEITVDPKIYDELVGTYKSDSGNKTFDKTFVVTKENDKLFGTCMISGGKIVLHPETESDFFASLDQKFSFIKNKDGKVAKVILHFWGQDITADKVEEKV